MPAADLPTQSVAAADPWNSPLDKRIQNIIRDGGNTQSQPEQKRNSSTGRYNEEPDPWKHPANRQSQEPYHVKGKGFIEFNPSPPWRQPVKPFTIDETLMTHAVPEGYPPLPDVTLRQLPGYLWKVKWTHVPSNIIYWYNLKYRLGYSASGVLGGGKGTAWPFIHFVAGISFIGYMFHCAERSPHQKRHAEFS